MELLERFVPLLVAVLTAVTPIVLAIHSSGRKGRAQERKIRKAVRRGRIARDSIDRMDTRIEILETHAQEVTAAARHVNPGEKLPIENGCVPEKNMWPWWNGSVKASTRCCWRSTGASEG
ncbi:MAG: hypothetical protein ACLVJ8_17805 [Ruthenibacterium lactatiformans]